MQLPDLDLKEDVEKLKAKEIKTTIEFPHCTHKDAQLNKDRTELRCKCGLAWFGTRLAELQQAFQLDN